MFANPWLWAVIGYVLGSIPFGLLLTKAAGLGDIRAIGSGNIGATNVLRTGNKLLAAATLLLDGGKGAAAVLLAGTASADAAILAGAGAFIGHLYPVWLKFKGGKGVATYIGTMIALSIWPAVGFGVAWLGTAFITRYSSLAALVAVVVTPVVAWFVDRLDVAALGVGMAALVFLKHEDNIRRLRRGEESRIGAKSAPADGEE
ncbi:glycerol-3-phosphate 1-O-acyltransferase PlsY [Pedomonas sp. V897]|uniref:glycerol-3-phosphate 1-O-acyltransferase PlsY n=1 Tax=Pedomonas sp. V897 TaxID=3446482 RepID=UPI003EE36A12